MHVEIGTEATQFPEKEYLNGIFVDMHVISSPCVYEPARYCFSTFYRANVSLWPCVIVPTSELLSKCVTMPPCYCGHLLPWPCDHTAKKIWNKYSQKRNFHIHVFFSDIYVPMIDLPILLQEKCVLILGICKSLTDTCMWKLGLRQLNSQKRNT
jgi:hypothetical protein